MLTSFPGLSDTAASVSGAAGSAKPGATQKQAADGDFAAIMSDVEGGAAAADTASAGAAVGPQEQPHVPGTQDCLTGAPRVAETGGIDPSVVNESGAKALNLANLAGFFRSMKTQGGQPEAVKGNQKGKTPTADTVPANASAAATEPTVVSDIVVVAEVPVAPHALPGIGTATVAGDGEGTPQGAEAPTTDVAPAVQLNATAAAVAAADPIAPGVAVAMDPAIAAAAMPAAPAPALAVKDAPAAVAIVTAQTPQVQIELQVAAALQDAAKMATTPTALDAAASTGDMTAQARGILETLNAALPQSQTSSTTPIFARPLSVSIAADGTDKAAGAPKIKITMGMGDVVSSRAERMSVTPRAMSPVFVMPPSASLLGSAATVTGEITASTLAEAHVTDQIVQSMKMQWIKGGGEATIELNPNGLGKVQVQVRVEHGAVSASVQAETSVVREFVASRRDELVQNLAQQGLRLDKLVVAETAKEQPARDGARDPRQAHREPARQRRDDRDANTDTFELNTPQENV